jgi:hypothetical protein
MARWRRPEVAIGGYKGAPEVGVHGAWRRTWRGSRSCGRHAAELAVSRVTQCTVSCTARRLELDEDSCYVFLMGVKLLYKSFF